MGGKAAAHHERGKAAQGEQAQVERVGAGEAVTELDRPVEHGPLGDADPDGAVSIAEQQFLAVVAQEDGRWHRQCEGIETLRIVAIRRVRVRNDHARIDCGIPEQARGV